VESSPENREGAGPYRKLTKRANTSRSSIRRVPLALPVRNFLQTPNSENTGKASGTQFPQAVKASRRLRFNQLRQAEFSTMQH
jgi:hypothetical protein